MCVWALLDTMLGDTGSVRIHSKRIYRFINLSLSLCLFLCIVILLLEVKFTYEPVSLTVALSQFHVSLPMLLSEYLFLSE